ncbi:MAG: carboxypeptidase regulatory-like domain-containing protein [Gemmatimonadetes bacterium]|nr:carboxypeptidase regulatory-like domain-containing protein [Gemmatimonadota bacterium]
MKLMSRLIVGAAGLLVITACDSTTEPPPPPPPPATGTITGTILVEGDPLGGVTVNLSGPATASTVSLADGTFAFASVLEGQYTVSITGFSAEVQFAQTTSAVTVAGGQTATVAFTGTFVRTASISGTVLIDGAGFQGVMLTLSGVETGTATTGVNGDFSFPGLRAGTFTVALSDLAADLTFAITERQVTLGVGDAVTVEFSGIQEKLAQVAIFALENAGGFRINASAVHDDVIVLVDVESGTQTVTKITVFLNAENVGEQELPTPAAAFGQQLAPQRLRFEVNTTAFDPNAGGPLFPNGPATFTVVVDTEQEGPGAAQTTLAITLVNADVIAGINFLGGAGGVVSGGKVWWGGGDLDFQIIPVIFDPDLTLSAIDVVAVGQPSANGGPSLDFGSGLGVAHRVMGPPFLFTATQVKNDGFVEDDPTRLGHTIRVVKVLDGAGLDITSNFLPGRAPPLERLWVDFVGPQSNPGTRLNVDGPVILGGEWFSAGVFGLSPAATETGVGGVTHQFDVTAEGLPVATNIAGIPELGERGLLYELELISMVDALGNQGPVANVLVSGLFGVDRTALTISDVFPTTTIILNPDDDAGDGVFDNRIAFKATDPELPDGSPGSGYGAATALGVDGAGNEVDLTSKVSPDASGANTLDPFILPEETYTFDIEVTDNATPGNTASTSVSFILDRTNPTAIVANPPPGNLTLTLSSFAWPFLGSVSDANGLSSAFLIMRDADTGGVCEVTDPKIPVGEGPGQVTPQNTFNLLADPDENTNTFDITEVRIWKNSGVVQVVCYFIEVSDNATDVFGNPEPNVNIFVLRTAITWL